MASAGAETAYARPDHTAGNAGAQHVALINAKHGSKPNSGLTASRRAATIAAGLGSTTEMKRRLSMLLALASAFALPAPAAAHASLVRAAPAAGSAVHKSPAAVRLWFSERLEPAYSTVEVVDRARKRVDNGDAGIDRANDKVLQVSLPQLPPGTYGVTWRVLSVDTHVSEGQFSFEIAP
jgi:methionine-rich copper-binding protein CopC